MVPAQRDEEDDTPIFVCVDDGFRLGTPTFSRGAGWIYKQKSDLQQHIPSWWHRPSCSARQSTPRSTATRVTSWTTDVADP